MDILKSFISKHATIFLALIDLTCSNKVHMVGICNLKKILIFLCLYDHIYCLL